MYTLFDAKPRHVVTVLSVWLEINPARNCIIIESQMTVLFENEMVF